MELHNRGKKGKAKLFKIALGLQTVLPEVFLSDQLLAYLVQTPIQHSEHLFERKRGHLDCWFYFRFFESPDSHSWLRTTPA